VFPKNEHYNMIVVGAGHAGSEAALAGARMGARVLLLTTTLDAVALMPCNPSVGGPAKANLVREIDALGGEMAKNVDATLMQLRMLNTRKGPAVRALRAQSDRKLYQQRMKLTLESTDNLYVKEALVTDLLVQGSSVRGVKVADGSEIFGDTVVLATGTYLRAVIYIGDYRDSSGPQGLKPANALGENLGKYVATARFKTGTPPRVHLRSVDVSQLDIQPGNFFKGGFSFETESVESRQLPCWLAYTNEETHRIVAENLDKAAIFTGAISGTGPRYCPSIESKVAQFPDRRGHQVFLEPEGWNTYEGYLSGLSSSLPAPVQLRILQSMKGFEDCEMLRPGYAIEYDCIDPLALHPTLQVKGFQGLYCAGQVNGTSGYEEAAGQGLLAGANAIRELRGQEPVVLRRSQAYLGVLIDDLVTKGTNEPYRMMTSRAEHRLVLRLDNADRRLAHIGRELGLVSEQRYDRCAKKWSAIERLCSSLESQQVRPGRETNELLQRSGSAPLQRPASVADLLRRPELDFWSLAPLHGQYEVEQQTAEQVEVEIKYSGYIEKQQRAIDRMERMENRSLEDVDFADVRGLSREAQEKLQQVRPRSVGQASRIAGVSPADVNVLLVYLAQRSKRRSYSEQ